MVAAEDEEVLGVLYLVREEQAYGLEGLLASVDVVAKEQVVSLRGEAPVLEEAQQVVVLSVDVAADLGGSQSQSWSPGGARCGGRGVE